MNLLIWLLICAGFAPLYYFAKKDWGWAVISFGMAMLVIISWATEHAPL